MSPTTPSPTDGGVQRLEIRPGVGAVVLDARGRILLHKRGTTGGWAALSGEVEPGEAVRTALLRELSEETGLIVRVERLVGIYSEPGEQIVTYPYRGRVHFVTCVFRCLAVGGRLSDSDEGSPWEWFAPEQLPEPLLPYTRRWILDAMGMRLVVR